MGEVNMKKIVIQILGGCLSCVHASEEMEVVVIDHDNIDDPESDSEAEAEAETKGLMPIY